MLLFAITLALGQSLALYGLLCLNMVDKYKEIERQWRLVTSLWMKVLSCLTGFVETFWSY